MKLHSVKMLLSSILVVLVSLTKGNDLCNSTGTRLETTANLTCDGVMYVYVDGTQLSEAKTSGYSNVQVYTVPVGSKVLAMACQREDLIPSRILGVVNGITFTGTKGWVCTNYYHRNWNVSDFVDSFWSSAVVYGKNGDIPYGKIDDISSDAMWIQATDNLVQNNTLYCRYSLCPGQACTYFHAKRIDHYKLIGHVFSSFTPWSIAQCALACAAVHNDCHSFNYISTPGNELCELNNSTQIRDPKSLQPVPGVFYYYKPED